MFPIKAILPLKVFRGDRLKISSRNKLPGVIKEIKLGEVAAEVMIESGTNQIVATITRGSVEDMGLKVGDNVTALVKASSVMVMK